MRYQFSQFALLLLTCLFVVGQSMFQIANIYDGLIWFFISSSSVIINDIFAYIFGIFFGRTRLIKLSPKKTVEGFLGSLLCCCCRLRHLVKLATQFTVFCRGLCNYNCLERLLERGSFSLPSLCLSATNCYVSPVFTLDHRAL